jgi:hypothetical protein
MPRRGNGPTRYGALVRLLAGCECACNDEQLSTGPEKSPLAGPLVDLANWTGGHVFVSSTPVERSLAARQIVEELRHQYLIAFESSGDAGWHQLAVRVRNNKKMVVRARSGYIAGHSRPNSL